MTFHLLLAAFKVRKGAFAWITAAHLGALGGGFLVFYGALNDPSLPSVVSAAVSTPFLALLAFEYSLQLKLAAALALRDERWHSTTELVQRASDANRETREEAYALKVELSEFITQAAHLSPHQRALALENFDVRVQANKTAGGWCDLLSDRASEALAMLEAADSAARALEDRTVGVRVGNWLAGLFSTRLSAGLMRAALFIAGPNRADYADQWCGHLAGAPEAGLTNSPATRVRDSLGFIKAAARMRSKDVTRSLWLPIDWILRKESRAQSTITLAVGAQAIYIVRHDGLHGLLTDGWGWCGGCALALHVFLKWLRRIRGIELLPTTREDPRA